MAFRRRYFATTTPPPPPQPTSFPQQSVSGAAQSAQKSQWKGAFASQHKATPNPAVPSDIREAYKAAKSGAKPKISADEDIKEKEAQLLSLLGTTNKQQQVIKNHLFSKMDINPQLQAELRANQQKFSNPDHDLISQDRNVKFPVGFVTVGALIIFCSYTATIFWDFQQDFKEQEIGEKKMKGMI